MVSISSSKLIRERTRDFCNNLKRWDYFYEDQARFQQITEFLEQEYAIIPEKERIGKGMVFISKYVAKEMFSFLNTNIKTAHKELIKFIDNFFTYGTEINSDFVQHFSLLILSEVLLHYSDKFTEVGDLIKKYANHEKWAIRESTTFSILSGLKKNPKETLNLLSEWAKDDNENIRRLVAESLRPSGDIKWLRDPSKNDKILEILALLKKDPSIYVRKSVGNNIKDLTKYMPEKMLELMENWIKEENIRIYDDLASEQGLDKEEKRLIWTMKQAMRWIKDREPNLHPQLERILGKNYVLYFNEKNNRLARPK